VPSEIVFAKPTGPMNDAPIRSDWIVEGSPVARNQVLAVSDDRLAVTLLWDCTAGRFHWRYDEDETIQILEGGVTLTLPCGRVRSVGPGEVVFFPKGSSALWDVQTYVRKLAFFRQPTPQPVALTMRLLRKVACLLRRPPRPAAPAHESREVLMPSLQ
jgi:uncharacterized cupin superfamily protein